MVYSLRSVRGALALAVLALASTALARQNAAKPAASRGGLPGGDQQQREQQNSNPTQSQNSAQNQQQRVTANQVATDGTTANNSSDHTIANWLAVDNQAEIAVAQAAADQLENKDVRKFAEMLAKDHGQMMPELQRFGAAPVRFSGHNQGGAAGQTRTSQQQDGQKNSNQNGRTQQGAAEQTGGSQQQGQAGQQQSANSNARTQEGAVAQTRTSQQQGQGQQQNQNGARPFNFLEVNREIAERCVATAQKELSEKKGTERDECFVGMQIAAHQKMIDTGRVLREHASPELQAVIDKAVETSESHLDQAKQLIHQLASHKHGSSDKDRDNQSEK